MRGCPIRRADLSVARSTEPVSKRKPRLFGCLQGRSRVVQTREGKKGWSYRTYALGDGRCDYAAFQPLFDLWDAKADYPTLPAWKDFDFPDFLGWHANLILYEVLNSPFDLRYRICGSKAVQAYGRDLTGMTLRIGAEDIQEDADLAFYQEMTEQRRYGTCEGPAYWRGRLFLKHAFLCLPLAESGDAVTHFMCFIHLEKVGKLN